MRISIGNSRKDTHWKVVELTWSELCSRLSNTTRTSETVSQYQSMSVDDKSRSKDVGGFVGGVIVNGRRTKGNMVSRSLVTLDADFATETSWDDVELLFDNAVCCYSTHSHTSKLPRLRFVIPLDREVTPEEYEPIARRLAADIGIDQFDVTTYETSRLMYWPSTSSDGEFVFKKQDGDFVCADDVLARYLNWHDTTEWPLGSTETKVRLKQAKSQGDPKAKNGIVGQFCRAYDIPTVIEKYLSDVYEPCQDVNRYTYIAGSTSAGVVLYDNGTFAFSHHSTDPAGGLLCNAFDLVRLHKFGDLDADADKEQPITQMPSYKEMCKLAQEDPIVKQLIVTEGIERARNAFDDGYETPSLDWTSTLETNKHGAVEATIDNLVKILNNDPIIGGKIGQNVFKGIPCIIADLPWHRCEDKANGDQWSDEDSSALAHYIETTYRIYSPNKTASALKVVLQDRAFHPVRDYLNRLEWDGQERAETLFIDFLGAEDSLYTRTVTRKWLTAAVARVMRPGIKFDNLVVLVGAQGIGKSYLGNLLGKGWFSDTFGTVQGKDAYEQLKGCWIIEIAELSAMKKAEVESVKMFISKREDNYRGAYREFASVNKRQCVFYGTTNDDSFLRDRTGNRRFWPIGVHQTSALSDVFKLTPEDINQIWAEAVTWYKQGESLYLNAEVRELAELEQDKYMTVDPRQGIIEDYLEKLIPTNWEELPKQRRREFIQGINFSDSIVGTERRMSVNVPEMAYELFGEEVLQPWQAKEYHNILTGIKGWTKSGKRQRSIYGQQYAYERTEEC